MEQMEQTYAENWQETMTDVQEWLKAWRAEHPQATMREIEVAVEREMARLGSVLMSGLAQVNEHGGRSEEGSGRVCPQCGGATIRRGRRKRELTGAYNETVKLTRSYVTCKQCGHGFFPSGQ